MALFRTTTKFRPARVRAGCLVGCGRLGHWLTCPNYPKRGYAKEVRR